MRPVALAASRADLFVRTNPCPRFPTFGLSVTFVLAIAACAPDSPSPPDDDGGLEDQTAADAWSCQSSGQTACDACVMASCCPEALTCSVGTACSALWTCARDGKCFAPEIGDFDACAVAACPKEATKSAVAALETLAACIRTHCSMACGF